jgi:hypothetical protein
MPNDSAVWELLDLSLLWHYVRPRCANHFGTNSKEMSELDRMWTTGSLGTSLMLSDL